MNTWNKSPARQPPGPHSAVGDANPGTHLRGRTADSDDAPAIHTVPLYARLWDGVVFERHVVTAPGSLPELVMPAHCLALPLSAPRVPAECWINGRLFSGAMELNHVYFRAAGDALATRWHERVDALYMTLSDAALRRMLGAEAVDTPLHSLMYTSSQNGVTDPPLLHTLHALHASVVEQRPGARLLEETLLAAIGLRMIDLFRRPVLGLDAAHARMAATPALLRRVEEYVQEHLGREALSIADIAACAGLSTFHLCKVFKQAREMSLWQYVLHCRVERAGQMMQARSPLPLTEIAAACGFGSYQQFLSAFRTRMGTLPHRFRAQAAMGADLAVPDRSG